jgi:dihydropyrimidinase
MEMIIKNGTIVTASEAFKADLLIKDGKIAAMGHQLESEGETIEAEGMYVCPAGVEIHTHIDSMIHGMRTVDDWYHASLGAAFGGTATVVDFPMQGQDQTLRQTIEEFKGRAKGKSIVDYAFTPIITKYTNETFEEIPTLIEEGMPGFKVFMYYNWQVNDYNLARMLDVVGSHGGLLHIHCENAGTIDYLGDKAIKQGRCGPEWHGRNRPESAELEATERVIYVAEELGVPVLIVHMSCGSSVKAVAKARARGVKVYGEAMPHFLLLDDSYYAKPGFEAMKYVVTPPLRSKENQDILWANMRTSTLSTVGSDHCAFPNKDKIRLFETRGSTFQMIPHGAPGIETRVPLIFSEGVSKGRISVTKFVELVATNPAKFAGLYPRKGTLAIGSDADITIIDPKKEVTIKQEMLHSNTDYTPFEGWHVTGYPVTTISRGQVLTRNSELVAKAGVGQFLKRDKFIPF